MDSTRYRNLLLTVIVLIFWTLGGCSHAPTQDTYEKPTLSEFEGKKVALVSIDGESASRSVAEVALINQLVKSGQFILISKQDVSAARAKHNVNPNDPMAVAKASDADLALMIHVKQFDAVEREGYSKEKEYDEQLAAERGEKEGHTERIFKVKSLTGTVKIELEFIDAQTGSTKRFEEGAEEVLTADARKGAIHFPPVLRFLEKLMNQAMARVFE